MITPLFFIEFQILLIVRIVIFLCLDKAYQKYNELVSVKKIRSLYFSMHLVILVAYHHSSGIDWNFRLAVQSK